MIHQTIWLYALSFVVLTINRTSSENQPAWKETLVDKLRRDLLTNYDRMARPSQHYNVTTVGVGIGLVSVEVIDMENVLAVHGSFIVSWNDDKLKWNSSDYGGISFVQFGAHELWFPDIYLLNSAPRGIEYHGNTKCVVYRDGHVAWVEQVVLHSDCHLDFTYWPFETNACRLSFRSWTYDGTQIDLRPRHNHIDDEAYISISEWILKNFKNNRRKEIFDSCPEPYVIVDLDFELSRSSKFYYYIIFIPIIPTVIISLITFWLQLQSEIKLIINASNILIVVMYLIYFGYKVPPRYDSMPIIVKFYSACLFQATVSMIISVFVLNIKHLAYFITIPRPIRLFLLGKPGRYLGLAHIIQEIESQKSAAERESCENLQDVSVSTSLANVDVRQQWLSPSTSVRSILNLEWILVATAINRLIFLLFCFSFSVMMLNYVRINRITDSYKEYFNFLKLN